MSVLQPSWQGASIYCASLKGGCMIEKQEQRSPISSAFIPATM